MISWVVRNTPATRLGAEVARKAEVRQTTRTVCLAKFRTSMCMYSTQHRCSYCADGVRLPDRSEPAVQMLRLISGSTSGWLDASETMPCLLLVNISRRHSFVGVRPCGISTCFGSTGFDSIRFESHSTLWSFTVLLTSHLPRNSDYTLPRLPCRTHCRPSRP